MPFRSRSSSSPYSASPYLRRGASAFFLALITSLLTGCQAAFFGGLNAAAGRPADILVHTVNFAPVENLSLDIYTPRHAINAPVIVFFYGGSWMSGKRQWYRWLGQTLSRRGLVVVIPDYRKWTEVRMDGFMHDASLAVAWTHAHVADYGGDPHALFLMGHSAGAHIAALLATDQHWLANVGMQPRQLSGFIGLAGPYDFLPLTDAKFIDMFGTTPQQQRLSQPVNFVDGDEPPMLLLQGAGDTVVAVKNAQSLNRVMQQHAEPVEMKIYPSIGHTAILLALSPSFENKAPVLEDSLTFIHAHASDQGANTTAVGAYH
jgi:acetyl esterase/lipase